MYQAGIKDIILYENTGINFKYFNPLNLRAITDLSGLGNIITIENIQQPEYSTALQLKGGVSLAVHVVKFRILGMSDADINQIMTSIYGWCMLVNYYDGTSKFYNTPVFFQDSKIEPQKEMSYEVELKTAVPTSSIYYEYTAGVSTVPIYRADTTILTADNTIYTTDYAL